MLLIGTITASSYRTLCVFADRAALQTHFNDPSSPRFGPGHVDPAAAGPNPARKSDVPAAKITSKTENGSIHHRDRSYCFTIIIPSRFERHSGMNTFHDKVINWSKRKRDSVQRISMMNKILMPTLAKRTSTLTKTRRIPLVGSAIHGKCQPPKNRIAVRKLIRDDVRVFGQKEHRELQSAIFGVVTADKLLLGLG